MLLLAMTCSILAIELTAWWLGVDTAQGVFKEEYQAQYWLRIEDEVYIVTGKARLQTVPDFKAVFESQRFLNAAAAHPEIVKACNMLGTPATAEWLQNHLEIKTRTGSELFIVGFTTTDPQCSADIANSLVDTYLKLESSWEAQLTQYLIDAWELERDGRAEQIARLRNELKLEPAAVVVTNGKMELQGNDLPKTVSVARIAELWDRAEAEVRRITEQAEASGLQEIGIPATELLVRRWADSLPPDSPAENDSEATAANSPQAVRHAKKGLSLAEQLILQSAVIDILSQRIRVNRTEYRGPARVTPLRAAIAPLHPKQKPPIYALATAGVIGFVLPFLLAFVWSFAAWLWRTIGPGRRRALPGPSDDTSTAANETAEAV